MRRRLARGGGHRAGDLRRALAAHVRGGRRRRAGGSLVDDRGHRDRRLRRRPRAARDGGVGGAGHRLSARHDPGGHRHPRPVRPDRGARPPAHGLDATRDRPRAIAGRARKGRDAGAGSGAGGRAGAGQAGAHLRAGRRRAGRPRWQASREGRQPRRHRSARRPARARRRRRAAGCGHLRAQAERPLVHAAGARCPDAWRRPTSDRA